MVLPHLQYCLMVGGDFEVGRNRAQGETLLKFQKRFVGLIAGKGAVILRILCEYGVLKMGDLYRQQLRLHAWEFWICWLPDSQVAMLRRVDECHGYGTSSARTGLVVGSGGHRSMGYRVPAEWHTFTKELRGLGSVARFKQSSKGDFLVGYGVFQCRVAGFWVCGD
jgi:hypothetical protein